MKQVLPAYAGMILLLIEVKDEDTSAPRIRGDDPSTASENDSIPLVLPAYAGMILLLIEVKDEDTSAPRIRGDDPDDSD